MYILGASVIEFIKNKLVLLSTIHRVDGIQKNTNTIIASYIEQYIIGIIG